MASQPGRERDYADATSRRAAEIQTAMVSIRRLGHETEFFRRSLGVLLNFFRICAARFSLRHAVGVNNNTASGLTLTICVRSLIVGSTSSRTTVRRNVVSTTTTSSILSVVVCSTSAA